MSLQSIGETAGALWGQYVEGRRQIEQARNSSRSISTAPVPRANPTPWILIAVGAGGLLIVYMLARRSNR